MIFNFYFLNVVEVKLNIKVLLITRSPNTTQISIALDSTVD